VDKHGAIMLRWSIRPLEFTVMSIKILQAKVDLIRTFSSIKECAMHPDPKELPIIIYGQSVEISW